MHSHGKEGGEEAVKKNSNSTSKLNYLPKAPTSNAITLGPQCISGGRGGEEIQTLSP